MFYSSSSNNNKNLSINEVNNHIEALSNYTLQELKTDINNHEVKFTNNKLRNIAIKTADGTFLNFELKKFNIDSINNLTYSISLTSENFDATNILEKKEQTFYNTRGLIIHDFFKDFFNFMGNMRLCKYYNKFLCCNITIDISNKKDSNNICENCEDLVNNCIKISNC